MGKLSRNEVFDLIEEDKEMEIAEQTDDLDENYCYKPNNISFKVEDPWKEYDKEIAKEKEDEKRIWMKEYNKFLKDEEPKDFPESRHLDDINDRVINLPKSTAYKDLLKEYLLNYRENLSFENIDITSTDRFWVMDTSEQLGLTVDELFNKFKERKIFTETIKCITKKGPYWQSIGRKKIVQIVKDRTDYDIFLIFKQDYYDGILHFDERPSAGTAKFKYIGINFKKE